MPSPTAKLEAVKVPVRLQADWELMKVDVKASGQTLPEFILGGWRLRKETARAAAAVPKAQPGESASSILARGVSLGRMFEDLRRALDSGRVDDIDVGGYRRWCASNRRRDAILLRQWLGALPRGPEYADWWDREIARVDDRQAGRTA